MMKKLASAGKLLINNPGEIRFAAKWLFSLSSGYSPVDDQRPWINYRATEWLESHLSPTMRVFEYGSGGSTLFLSKRVAQVVSAEHDEGFYHYMKEKICHHGITNCTYILRAPKSFGRDQIPDYSAESFSSEWPAHKTMNFEEYVKSIDEYPNGHFDLITVDGRARPSCALRALPKLKNGGWLLVDNMERARYKIIRDLLASYECQDFLGLVPCELRLQRTTAWRIDTQK
ncbi:MAG: hypothetical protein P8164_08990 [Gammaproteobacteria bacterium]|jgi:hypothetical protein